MIKKKIINILIGISIVLLLGNVLIDVLNKNSKVEIKEEISVSQVDSIFFDVIAKFELNDDWIEKKIIKNDKLDSLKYVFNIKVPKDVPIASILKEINYGYFEQPVEIESEEKINFGKTVLKISSNDKLKLQVFFNVDKEILREYSQLAFILINVGNLNDEEFIKLMRIPYPYAVLLVPEENSLKLIPQINEFRKEVFLLLNDDVNEKKYSLDTEYEKRRLKNSILTIISDFPKVINYVVDTESDIYKSTSYNYIKDEFTKRNVKISDYSKFINLDKDSKKEISSLIQFYVSSGKSQPAKTFLISADNFIELERDLAIMFNKGTKYTFPSKVN